LQSIISGMERAHGGEGCGGDGDEMRIRIAESKLRGIVRRGLLLEYAEGRCPGCGEQGPVGKNFCRHCGTKMGVCPHEGCGAPLNDKPTQKFCVQCGNKVPMNEASGGGSAWDGLDEEKKKKLGELAKGFEALEKATQASKASLGKKSELRAAIDEKQRIFKNFIDAHREKDLERMQELKGEIRAANERIVSAAKDDISNYDEWERAMREAGGQGLPASMRKRLEDDLEQYRSKGDDDEEFLGRMEQTVRDVVQRQKEAEDLVARTVADLEKKTEERISALRRPLEQGKKEKEKLHRDHIESIEGLLAEVQKMLGSAKEGSRPSREEIAAYEEIVVPYNEREDEIWEKEKELMDRLGSLIDKAVDRESSKRAIEFKKEVYLPFIREVLQPHYRQYSAVWSKFFKRVKSKGESVSKDNLDHLVQVLNLELKHQRELLEIYN
jgi:hypothetical protein